MENSWWIKKENKSNYWWLFFLIIIGSILLVWKDIIESWYFIHTIIFLIVLFVAYLVYLWIEKNNRDKPASLWKEFEKKYPIIIQYTPPKWINPAEAWLLYNCSVEPTDLTSLIYQRKFENLIDIVVFKWDNSWKEYVKLIKKSDIPLARPFFETEIFESIFALNGVKVIEWAFQLRYALMLEDLETHWIKKWWIVKTSWWNKFNKLYSFLVSLFFICAVTLISWKAIVIFPYVLWASFVLFLCCVFLGWYMYGWWKLKFTDRWAKLASHLIGYRNFIKSCDENKIRLFLEEDPLFIDRTLPYATAFGMETEFLKKVSPLKKDWNAKYFRWQKIPSWIWVLRFFFPKDDDSLL